MINNHLFQAISDSIIIYFCLFQANFRFCWSNFPNFRQFSRHLGSFLNDYGRYFADFHLFHANFEQFEQLFRLFKAILVSNVAILKQF